MTKTLKITLVQLCFFDSLIVLIRRLLSKGVCLSVQEGRDKRFLIQKLYQAQQAVCARSPRGFRRTRPDAGLYLVEPSVVLETQA